MPRLSSIFSTGNIVVGLIVVTAAAGGFYLYWNGDKSLEFTTVSRHTLKNEARFSGAVEADKRTEIGFDSSGRVTDVTVTEGDEVTEGDLLARVENRQERATVAEVNAELQEARTELRRLRAGDRPEQVRATKADLEAAEATVRKRREELFISIEDSYRVAAEAIYSTVDQYFRDPRSLPKLTLGYSDKSDVTTHRARIQDILDKWKFRYREYSIDGDLTAYVTDVTERLRKIRSFLDRMTDVVTSKQTDTTTEQQSAILGAWKDVKNALLEVRRLEQDLKEAQATAAARREAYTIAKEGGRLEDIEKQEAVVARRRAALERAKADRDDTRITAPFDGVITDVAIDPGEIATTDATVITMISDEPLEIEGEVSELDIAGIRTGMSATTTFDALGADREFRAEVIHIDPAETVIDNVPTYEVTLRPHGTVEALKPGMTANIRLVTRAKEDVLAVPAEALATRTAQEGTVLVRGDGTKTQKRDVSLGMTGTRGYIEITDGLSEEEQIVVNP